MKRSNWLAAVAFLGLLLATAAYATRHANAFAPNVLRAEKLELVDSGKVTAVLQASPDGLEIRGPDGKLRAMVGFAVDRVSALTLFDEAGRGRISLDMTSDGQAEIHLASEDGERSLSLIAPPKGGPGLYLEREEGRAEVGLNEAGKLVVYRGCGVEPYVVCPES
jgi:hypothetical protein